MLESDDPLAEWDFALPRDRIARHPAARRDASRLMVLPRDGGGPLHRHVGDLPGLLRPGDLLVGNDTRVMAARLAARRATGGAVELLLLEPGPGPVRALARPARKLKVGDTLWLDDETTAVVRARGESGEVVVELSAPPARVMERLGHLPLPPYLGRPDDAEDRERYQTVYAGPLGAAAAPTAGLHFTPGLLDALAAAGIGFATVTLHVGLGTFRPLGAADLRRGALHEERYVVGAAVAAAIADTRAHGGRVVAIGTTAARTLESATPAGERVPRVEEGSTTLFVRPPYAFRCIDGLLTNFHLPRSSLLMLVAALVDRERLLSAYSEAMGAGYRFYSYGDAMLLV